MAVPTGEGADTYAPLLQAVRADRRAFPGDELFAKNLLAVRLGGAAIVGIAAAAAGVLNIVLRLAALVGSCADAMVCCHVQSFVLQQMWCQQQLSLQQRVHVFASVHYQDSEAIVLQWR